jgi:predicted MFS family arabinose efflux permease
MEEFLLHQDRTGLSFRRLIGTGMSAKLVVDIGSQIFNPFLPLIASGIGTSVVELGRMVGLRSAMGVFAPISGALSDRFGYRLVIRVALLVMAAGCLLMALSTSPWMVLVAILMSGLGTSAFVPNLQAFVSGHLPYRLRARGLGMIEYSWALTGIFGLSLVGLLIAATSWRMPFFLLAGGMLMMSFIFGAMPGAHKPPADSAGDQLASASTPAVPSVHKRTGVYWLRRMLSIFVVGPNWRSTYGTILSALLSFYAAMQIMISHGAWLVRQYGLDAAALGLVALVIGCFDLVASVAVSVFTDRIGKKRSVLIGMGGSLIAYLVLPFLDRGVIPAVAGIAMARMFFEFNIVAYFPLLSEQVPAKRGQVMTLGTAISTIGTTLAGFTGPWMYVNHGVAALAWTSAGAIAMALAIVVIFVREGEIK